jgi:hypothetical protein
METTGNSRRVETADSLAGSNRVVPTPRSSPNLSVNAVPAQVDSVANQISNALSNFASDALTNLSNTEQQKSMLDGQMAYQQGKAIEDVEMDGNKWALEGYRLMQAQTISSSMLASQQELISQTGYQDDPDTFRQQYVNQLEQQTAGLDTRTADMVRQTMTKQMPALVSSHTTAHLQYLEEQNFKSLEAAIDVVSRDPTATDEFLNMVAGGEGSISEGLSDNRRNKAVAIGVVRAFENGNPQAYSILKKNGLLDNLSVTDKQMLDNAEKNYQLELRSQYDAQFEADKRELVSSIASGEMTGIQAQEAFAKLYADHNMSISDVESKAAYTAGEDAQDLMLKGDEFLLEQARMLGDSEAEEAILARINAQGGSRPKTAEQRLKHIQEVNKTISDALDQEAQMGMQLSQIEIDEDYKQGRINTRAYLERSKENRDNWGVSLTSSITSHTVSQIENVRNAAVARQKEAIANMEANQREALDAKYQQRKAQFEFDISNVTNPEEAIRLSREYETDVIEMYSSEGISLKEMNYSAITANTAGEMYRAISKGMKYQEEEQIINRAVSTGTVGNLPDNLQKRYFQKTSSSVADFVREEVAKGAIPQDNMEEVLTNGLLGTYIEAGTVDPQFRNESIAVLNRPSLVNKDGTVDPTVLRVMEQYVSLKKTNPLVAKTMLDDRTEVIASQIIEASGGIEGNIQDGLLAYSELSKLPGGFEENTPELTERTMRRVRKEVKRQIGRADIGMWQVLFTDATKDQLQDRTGYERALLRSQETKDIVQAEIEAEVMRRAMLVPGSDPALLVKDAAQDVANRVSFVGGFSDNRDPSVGGPSVVVMNPGKGIKQQLFGSKALELDRADIENEVIVDFLQDLSKQPGFEFISQASVTGQLGTNIVEVFTDTDRGTKSLFEVGEIKRRGVRPFMLLTDGNNVSVRVQRENGSLSTPIPLNLPQIGENYMRKYHSDLIK